MLEGSLVTSLYCVRSLSTLLMLGIFVKILVTYLILIILLHNTEQYNAKHEFHWDFYAYWFLLLDVRVSKL